MAENKWVSLGLFHPTPPRITPFIRPRPRGPPSTPPLHLLSTEANPQGHAKPWIPKAFTKLAFQCGVFFGVGHGYTPENSMTVRMVEEIRWVNSPVDIRYISLLFYRVFWYIPTGANMSSWRWMVQILNSFLNGWFVGSSCESSRLHSATNMDPKNDWFAKFGMSFSRGKTTILRGKFC